jgi:RNA polymerase sigma-70 factor (ECF subfamily)
LLNEESLIRQAAEGNQSAFTQLYNEHFDRIYRYVRFLVNFQAEAEDLTQEVFIKALRAISSYKRRGGNFTSWLFRIAHNQVIDHFRKQSKQRKTTLEETTLVSGDDPVTTTEQKIEIEGLMTALKKLPSAQREVISLRFIVGLPIADVARTLGKREGTIKALQFNAMASIKKILPEKENA